MVTLTLSCAVSSDGYLDDRSSARAILSSSEDLEGVLALRARSEMIVIGAETLRRDNPSLATRGAAHFETRQSAGLAPDPVKVVVTRSGKIPHDCAFFETGSGETIVLSQTLIDAPGTVELFQGGPIDAIIDLAKARNLTAILIEGGAQMLTLALPRARWLRLAISPRKLDEHGYARLFDDPAAFMAPLDSLYQEMLGDTAVFHIDLLRNRAKPIMEAAFSLSERCPPNETAFAVGCIGCDEDLSVLATGFSRETGPSDHAEEAMLSKLSTPPHTVICTLEPCLTRASKPKGCAQRLVDAGVKRLIYAVAEDNTFTQQTGLAHLQAHGVDVIELAGYEERFHAVNPLIYGPS